jgi:hypothetical protein
MGNYHHPWILRRIFGNQPVGCVGRPSRPKAGIGAQVIRASSSDWTFRGPSVVHCRLGKSDDRGYRASYYSTTTVEVFQPSSTPQMSRNSPQPPPPNHATPSQGPAICPDVLSGITARQNLPQISLSKWKQRGTPMSTLSSQQHVVRHSLHLLEGYYLYSSPHKS